MFGPAGVIGGLPEAAKLVKDPASWFAQASEESARWMLPDRSVAVLYRQRRDRRKPVVQRRVTYPFFEAGTSRVRSMSLEFGAWDPALVAWKTTRVKAAVAEIRDLAVRGIEAELEGFSFTGFYEGGRGDFEWNELRLMRLTRLKIKSLRSTRRTCGSSWRSACPAPGHRPEADATLKASGSLGKSFFVEAVPEFDPAARRLRVNVLSMSYMGTPLPPALLRPIKELGLSLDPTPETPFYIELPGLTVKGGRLTVP